jgi:hypothetical protein
VISLNVAASGLSISLYLKLILDLASCASLALLVALIFKLWPSYRLDVFRQRMFAVRDDLFAYAASGKIDFSDPAYRLLRQAMNGFLRYGHNLTLYRLCITLVLWHFEGRPRTKWAEAWTLSLDGIKDEQIRKDLQSFHARAMGLVADRVIFGSPVLWVVLLLCTVVLLIKAQWQGVKQIAASASRRTLERIVDPRLLEEEASRLAA